MGPAAEPARESTPLPTLLPAAASEREYLLRRNYGARRVSEKWRIIGVADTDWFGPWMSRQQILARLAKRHAVSFSRGALSVSDRFSREWFTAPMLGKNVEADGVQVERRSSLMLRWPRFPKFDDWVVRRAARRMIQAMPCRSGEKRIAYLFHPRMVEYGRA